MSVEPEPYMEPADGAQDDSTAASRKRHSMAYRASHDGSIEVRDVAASESGTDEFSSLDGDNTFTSMMLKLLTATTGGDEIIVIDIYDLLRRAHTHCRSSYLPHPPQFATNERAPVHFCRPQLPSPAC